MTAFSVEDFKREMEAPGATVVDTRKPTDFTQGFVPGSISIGLDGRFAEWAGNLLRFDTPILLVSEDGQEQDAQARLSHVGFSNIRGHLEGGYEAWKQSGNESDMIIDVEADELAMDLPFDQNLVVMDVRREAEFGDGHIANATNIPLDELSDPAAMGEFEENHNIYIHCGAGYRSVIAASLLKRQGIHNLRNVLGGWDKIKEQKNIQIVKENRVLN